MKATLLPTLGAAITSIALLGCANTRSPTQSASVTHELRLAEGSPPYTTLPRRIASSPTPVYPFDLRKASVCGMVNIDCIIDEQGRVMMAQVIDSCHSGFNKPTLKAVNDWTFEPATRDGIPVAARVVLPIEYVMASY